jgi:radical SAM protein with 4Fe4S-binding SPASM domain
MNLPDYLSYLGKILGHKGFRAFGFPRMMPTSCAYSVTNMCNSKCRTCNIWRKYKKSPGLAKQELTTEEWLKTWKSIGKTTFCVWTGGEPFLRNDAYELLKGVYEYNRPKILTICTNASMPKRIEEALGKFLPETSGDTDITVNISIDGIGRKHDEIRRLPGNWKRMLETVKAIRRLQKKHGYPNLCFHTVVSKWNVNEISHIYDYVVNKLKPDVYIMEPAELRYEMDTIGTDIMPSKEELSRVFRVYSSKKNVTRLTNIIRKIYIDKYIKGEGLPCYAAFNHVQVTANGNVWPCCILADTKALGSLREVDFDFRKIWFSKRADEIRKKVKERAFPQCKNCYLAVVANTSIPQNMLLTALYMLREH